MAKECGIIGNQYADWADEVTEKACLQIGILNYYDPENNEDRLKELHEFLTKAIISQPSHESLSSLEKLVKGFEREIYEFRRAMPDLENKKEVMEKLAELKAELKN